MLQSVVVSRRPVAPQPHPLDKLNTAMTEEIGGELKDAVGKLGIKTKAIWIEWDEIHDDRECLYHYTTAKGLFGILSSRVIWASNALHLNDFSEFEYGFGVVKEVVEGLANDPLQLKHVFLDPERWSQEIGGSAYVTCLSADGDKLSQWRAYAAGGRGYAVGFGRNALVSHQNADSYALIRILYDRTQQRRFVQQQIDFAVNLLLHLRFQGAAFKTFRVEVGMELLKSIAHFKHTGFAEEEEWRLLSMNPRWPKFRLSASRMIPYAEMTFPEQALQKVIVGPGADRQIGRFTLQQLLNQAGWSAVVEFSGIPLRP